MEHEFCIKELQEIRIALKTKVVDLRNQIRVIEFYKTEGIFFEALDLIKLKIENELSAYCSEVIDFLSRIKVEQNILSDCDFIVKGLKADYFRYSG